ncbi:MAG: DNA/RNA nuclease SfsA [Chloroflexi bacterium]|nr:DNA/RNA nuclease SfsA [Chloroflexota bacterium]
MRLPAHLTEAVFLARLNRFAALVRLNGAETLAHVPNSGRLRELLQPGNRIYLTPAPPSATRVTQYDLSLVDLGGCLVSADARAATTLAYEWLTGRLLPEFTGYTQVVRESTFGESRLDLLLLGDGPNHYVEVKSATLVHGDTALFPDAPTTRGRKHVGSLMKAVEMGHQASVLFVVQRSDAGSFSPNDDADPAFGAALRKACAAGVRAYAYNCRLTLQEITLHRRLPVVL